MRLLLTSGGVTNPSIRDALVDLLDKPIADSSALCIPTAEYGHPMCTPASCRDPRPAAADHLTDDCRASPDGGHDA